MQNSHIIAIVRKKPTVCIYVCYMRAERKLQNTATVGSQKVKWVQFLSPTWRLTIICSSSGRGILHPHTDMQAKNQGK